MTTPSEVPAFTDAIYALVESVPDELIASLATAVAVVPPGKWLALHVVAQRALPRPHYRAHIGAFIAQWQNYAPDVSPQSVALALQVARRTLIQSQRSRVVELVWSSPDAETSFRPIIPALQQMIDETRRVLVVVSLAIYDIPEIAQALRSAGERRVRMQLIVDSPWDTAGRLTYASLESLGPQVIAHTEILRWPAEQRPVDVSGRFGALCARCVVADEHALLISSANLATAVMGLNMEMGLLVQGGTLPRQAAQHFEDLIRNGTFVPAGVMNTV